MNLQSQNASVERGRSSPRALAETGVYEDTLRSNYGTVPGSELPTAVYTSVFAAFAWIVITSLIAFAHGADADLALGFAVVLTIIFFGLPLLVWLTANAHAHPSRKGERDFLSSPVETATATLTGGSAWLQIMLIPASLALGATLIGVTSILVH